MHALFLQEVRTRNPEVSLFNRYQSSVYSKKIIFGISLVSPTPCTIVSVISATFYMQENENQNLISYLKTQTRTNIKDLKACFNGSKMF